MNVLNLRDKNRPLQLILKVPGNGCNIACEYCFEKGKNVSHDLLTPDVLSNIIDKANNKVIVTFHGGEPLLIGKRKFIELLDVVRSKIDKIDSVFIQSNGTLLDEEWIEILYCQYGDLNIEISLSLDGSRSMNYLRVDYDEVETFQRVIDAYKLLHKHGIKAGLLSVISKNSLNKAEEYVQLLSSIPNIKFVKLNALFNMEKNELTQESITPTQYANFIIDVSRLYIKNKLYTRFPLEPFLSIMQAMKNKASRYCNYSKSKCLNFISVYPDGMLGPCDCLPATDFTINLNERESLDDAIERCMDLGNYKTINKLMEECDECDVFNFCQGGCLSQRYYFKDNLSLKEDFCNSKHTLYTFGKEITKHD
ncbi:radical SAM/SPASM domain-containing protein [uncultured Megasphaera sp.]|uniref:radical SAM/SPASM domain-containing protein n=1 Tax=uncultured Megasphaera sp. TaxID=165188 RepID=UPI00260A3104|nr:radical SAM protein [uncultured Megasphaera sp.]